MAKNKRSVWEELVEVGRQILDDIDELLDPKPKQSRKPARVPIPVRNNPHRQPRQPYEQD